MIYAFTTCSCVPGGGGLCPLSQQINPCSRMLSSTQKSQIRPTVKLEGHHCYPFPFTSLTYNLGHKRCKPRDPLCIRPAITAAAPCALCRATHFTIILKEGGLLAASVYGGIGKITSRFCLFQIQRSKEALLHVNLLYNNLTLCLLRPINYLVVSAISHEVMNS